MEEETSFRAARYDPMVTGPLFVFVSCRFLVLFLSLRSHYTDLSLSLRVRFFGWKGRNVTGTGESVDVTGQSIVQL